MPDQTRKPLRIGLDFDDTLMHTREALLELLNAIHNTSVRAEECTDYYFTTPWNLTDEQFAQMFNAHEDRIHKQPPLEGLLDTLRLWSDPPTHATFHVITGRPDCWLPSAASWLHRHNIRIEDVISARTAGGKGVAARSLSLDFFIEDHFQFAREVADAGIPVFLIDRPYNRNLAHPLITRVKDWHHIRQSVNERLSSHLTT